MLRGKLKARLLVDQIMNDNPFVYIDLPPNLGIRAYNCNEETGAINTVSMATVWHKHLYSKCCRSVKWYRRANIHHKYIYHSSGIFFTLNL